MTENQTWNAGQMGRTRREKDALLKKIHFQNGHWLWVGAVGIFGNPIVLRSGDVVSAASAVWETWRRNHMPPTARRCAASDQCVRPDCWER